MMAKTPANLKELSRLIKRGEGPTLEFKRSTAELREGMQTICAFLNGSGGMVLFGARSDGVPEGQQVSDKTLREIAQAFERFEPPVNIDIRRVKVKDDREVLVLSVDGSIASRPCLFEGRPYERLETATCRMPQEKYEKLLLERVHSRSRWENAPAEEVEPRDLDRDEVFRILDAARSSGRLIGSVGNRVVDMLDRLGVRRNRKILQAAMVLFGRTFLPDYPQCELRMARFRGTDKTEFLDQRQIRGPAFKLLEEAELFCQRHFPLPGKIVSGRMERVDTPLVPPDAMREIFVNALIHRDYSIAGGAVSLAIFDNRVEIWSAGTYPAGITPDMLTRDHPSVQRNPIIADVFYRAGLIERWGRGTNRVIEMCRTANVHPPEFQEIGHAAVVTFRVNVAGAVRHTPQVTEQVTARVTGQVGSKSQLESGPSRREFGTKSGLSRDQVKILRLCRKEGTLLELMNSVGRKNRTKFRDQFIKPLLGQRLLQMTIPDKPRSRLQRYRTTAAGESALSETVKK